jgi:hypothetical protein
MFVHGLIPTRRQTRARRDLGGPILLRRSRPDDTTALRRLAELDSRSLPDGAFLLAEVGDVLVDAAPIADPFEPTDDVCHLLQLRARQMRTRTITHRLDDPTGARQRGLEPHAA